MAAKPRATHSLERRRSDDGELGPMTSLLCRTKAQKLQLCRIVWTVLRKTVRHIVLEPTIKLQDHNVMAIARFSIPQRVGNQLPNCKRTFYGSYTKIFRLAALVGTMRSRDDYIPLDPSSAKRVSPEHLHNKVILLFPLFLAKSTTAPYEQSPLGGLCAIRNKLFSNEVCPSQRNLIDHCTIYIGHL